MFTLPIAMYTMPIVVIIFCIGMFSLYMVPVILSMAMFALVIAMFNLLPLAVNVLGTGDRIEAAPADSRLASAGGKEEVFDICQGKSSRVRV